MKKTFILLLVLALTDSSLQANVNKTDSDSLVHSQSASKSKSSHVKEEGSSKEKKKSLSMGAKIGGAVVVAASLLAIIYFANRNKSSQGEPRDNNPLPKPKGTDKSLEKDLNEKEKGNLPPTVDENNEQKSNHSSHFGQQSTSNNSLQDGVNSHKKGETLSDTTFADANGLVAKLAERYKEAVKSSVNFSSSPTDYHYKLSKELYDKINTNPVIEPEELEKHHKSLKRILEKSIREDKSIIDIITPLQNLERLAKIKYKDKGGNADLLPTFAPENLKDIDKNVREVASIINDNYKKREKINNISSQNLKSNTQMQKQRIFEFIESIYGDGYESYNGKKTYLLQAMHPSKISYDNAEKIINKLNELVAKHEKSLEAKQNIWKKLYNIPSIENIKLDIMDNHYYKLAKNAGFTQDEMKNLGTHVENVETEEIKKILENKRSQLHDRVNFNKFVDYLKTELSTHSGQERAEIDKHLTFQE